MEVTPNKPATELASLVASSLQNTRFKERRLREAESDVRSEAVFYSPVIRIDTDTQTVVLQYRDSQTGEPVREFPQKAASDVYMAAQENVAAQDIVVEKPVEEVSPQGQSLDLDS